MSIVRGSMLCVHLISVVWTADKIKEFGHWVRCGVGDSTLPGSYVEKDNTFNIYQQYDTCSAVLPKATCAMGSNSDKSYMY